MVTCICVGYLKTEQLEEAGLLLLAGEVLCLRKTMTVLATCQRMAQEYDKNSREKALELSSQELHDTGDGKMVSRTETDLNDGIQDVPLTPERDIQDEKGKDQDN